MQVRETPFGFLLLLEPGDELIRSLTRFARQYDVDAAVLMGIGLVHEVELGSIRGERRRVFREPLEACSLQGNIALLEGEPMPHVHGIFSRVDCSTIGGHVYEAVCSGTIELSVHVSPEAVFRDGALHCGLTFERSEEK